MEQGGLGVDRCRSHSRKPHLVWKWASSVTSLTPTAALISFFEPVETWTCRRGLFSMVGLWKDGCFRWLKSRQQQPGELLLCGRARRTFLWLLGSVVFIEFAVDFCHCHKPWLRKVLMPLSEWNFSTAYSATLLARPAFTLIFFLQRYLGRDNRSCKNLL